MHRIALVHYPKFLEALKVIELVDFTILFEEEILMYRKGKAYLLGNGLSFGI